MHPRPKIVRKIQPEFHLARDRDNAAELHSNALHQLSYIGNYIAVAGSIFNATAYGIQPAISLQDLAEFICSQKPRAELTTIKHLMRSGGAIDLLHSLSEVEHLLEACIRDAHQDLTADNKRPIGRDAGARAWQKLASSVNALDADLVAALNNSSLLGADATDTPYRKLLREVANSGWPCIDADGNVLIPDGCTLRTVTRHTINAVPVEVCLDGRWQDAEIIDYCDGGFGLAGSFDALETGSPIFIQFAATLGVVCIVRWTRRERFGVSVNAALQRTILAKLGLASGELGRL